MLSSGKNTLPTQQIKCLIVGQRAAGKSTLVASLKSLLAPGQRFDVWPTFLIQRSLVALNTARGPTELVLWDTEGEAGPTSELTPYLRKCDALVIVFDCSAPNSIEKTRKWLDCAYECYHPRLQILLVANKLDSPQATSLLRVRELINAQHPQRFIERGENSYNLSLLKQVPYAVEFVSAAAGVNVLETFRRLADSVQGPLSPTLWGESRLGQGYGYVLLKPANAILEFQESSPIFNGRCC